jgi:hypothetical protein
LPESQQWTWNSDSTTFAKSSLRKEQIFTTQDTEVHRGNSVSLSFVNLCVHCG